MDTQKNNNPESLNPRNNTLLDTYQNQSRQTIDGNLRRHWFLHMGIACHNFVQNRHLTFGKHLPRDKKPLELM